MITNKTQLRIKYADIDKMGYVYYGNYPAFLEYGRTELFRNLNISYKNIEDLGYIMPVTTLNIQYLKPAQYDDIITIKTYLINVSLASLSFEYEIFNQDEILLTKAFTKLACINISNNKISKLPKNLLDKLQ